VGKKKKLMPLNYTRVEGGELLKWRGGLVDMDSLRPHKQAIALMVNGIYVNMLDFGAFKWDVVNGVRDE